MLGRVGWKEGVQQRSTESFRTDGSALCLCCNGGFAALHVSPSLSRPITMDASSFLLPVRTPWRRVGHQTEVPETVTDLMVVLFWASTLRGGLRMIRLILGVREGKRR